MKEKYPDRFVLNTAWDPRDEEAGLAAFEEKVRALGLQGREALHRRVARRLARLEPQRPRGPSATSRSASSWASRTSTSTRARRSGRSNKDAFDVSEIDHAATNFTDLNFIVEHVGMPRIEDFCWIGVQEPNVYGGLAVLMPFIHPRPKYFADVMAELLFWLGEDRLLFASDYALWHPKWIVEKFVDFDLPEQVTQRDRRLAERRGQAEDPRPERVQALRHRPGRARRPAAGRRVRRQGRDRPGPAGRGRARRGGQGVSTSLSAAREALDRVMDPELDRSLVALDFVQSARGGERRGVRGDPAPHLLVLAELRLPHGGRRPRGAPRAAGGGRGCGWSWWTTSPASGSRRPSPPGSRSRRPSPTQADGELGELRRRFRLKAFVVRQEPPLRAARQGARRRGRRRAAARRRRAPGVRRSLRVGRVPGPPARPRDGRGRRGALAFTDAQGEPLAAEGLDRLPAARPLGADQPRVEHGVLHRPARGALRRPRGVAAERRCPHEGGAASRVRRGALAGGRPGAGGPGAVGRDREGRRGRALPHRPPHHRGDLEGEGQRRAALHPRARERRLGRGRRARASGR